MNIKDTLKCNSCNALIVVKIIKKYVGGSISTGNSKIIKEKDMLKVRSVKFSYVGLFSEQLRNKLQKLFNQNCKERNIKTFFTSFKLVYKYNCTRCNSCYICETCHHFQTRIDESRRAEKNVSIYKQENEDEDENEDCFNSFF